MGKYNLKNMKSLIIIILLATVHLAITDDYPPTSTTTNPTTSTTNPTISTTKPTTSTTKPTTSTTNKPQTVTTAIPATPATNTCLAGNHCQGCDNGTCTSCLSYHAYKGSGA